MKTTQLPSPYCTSKLMSSLRHAGIRVAHFRVDGMRRNVEAPLAGKSGLLMQPFVGRGARMVVREIGSKSESWTRLPSDAS